MKPSNPERIYFLISLFLVGMSACRSAGTSESPAAQPSPQTQAENPPTETFIPRVHPTVFSHLPTEAAAPSQTPVSHPDWTSYTSDWNSVYAMQFDKNGSLWSTAQGGGVLKWDVNSNTYVQFTKKDGLLSDHITAIAAAPDGSMWFAADPDDPKNASAASKGFTHYDGNHWISYTTQDGVMVAGDIASMAVASDGTLWAAGGEVESFDGNSWKKILSDSSGNSFGFVSSAAISPNGDVWFAGDHGAIRYDGKTWKVYTTNDGLQSANLSSVAIAPDGLVWVGGPYRALSSFDGKSWTNYSIPNGPMSFDRIAVTSHGDLWTGVGPKNSGMVYFYHGGKWDSYTAETGLQNENILSVTVGPDDSPWFGTDGGGIFRFDGKTSSPYIADAPIGKEFDRIAVSKDESSLWLFSRSFGISHLNGNRWTDYVSILGLPPYYVIDISMAPDNTIWMTSSIPLWLHFDGKIWKGVQFAQYVTITFLEVAPDSTLWFGTFADGLIQINGSQLIKFPLNAPGAGRYFKTPSCMAAAPDGSLWFGTGAGLAHFLNGKWTYYVMPDVSVNAVAVNRNGEIWMGTDAGAFRFNPTSPNDSDLTGLAGNKVASVAAAPDGAFWFGTYQGLFKYDGAAWKTWTTEDGLLDNSINDIAVTADGAVWMATNGGVSRFLESAE